MFCLRSSVYGICLIPLCLAKFVAVISAAFSSPYNSTRDLPLRLDEFLPKVSFLSLISSSAFYFPYRCSYVKPLPRLSLE